METEQNRGQGKRQVSLHRANWYFSRREKEKGKKKGARVKKKKKKEFRRIIVILTGEGK